MKKIIAALSLMALGGCATGPEKGLDQVYLDAMCKGTGTRGRCVNKVSAVVNYLAKKGIDSKVVKEMEGLHLHYTVETSVDGIVYVFDPEDRSIQRKVRE